MHLNGVSKRTTFRYSSLVPHTGQHGSGPCSNVRSFVTAFSKCGRHVIVHRRGAPDVDFTSGSFFWYSVSQVCDATSARKAPAARFFPRRGAPDVDFRSGSSGLSCLETVLAFSADSV